MGPATAAVVESATTNVNSNNPLPIALQYLGVNELDPRGNALRTELWDAIHGKGSANSKEMTNSNAPWCAAFVNYVLGQTGTPDMLSPNGDPFTLGRAQEFGRVGSPVPGKNKGQKLNNAKPGDVVVLRGSEGWHVSFYAGHDPQSGKVYLLGGNQADSVKVSAFDSKTVTDIRRVRVDRLTNNEQEEISKLITGQPTSSESTR